ncbi:hypothetical protein WJX81_004997 [Elliptochloris bilobata]|uniref:CCHC-type domain-containing protein n=1 Tax=Elliptochloris bilobata TaxID=381761 RepID=A0AAW1SIV6_9CHLO
MQAPPQTVACYKCGKTGHWSHDCPGQGCYKCGKTGHWSRDCTAPPSEWVKRAFPADGTPARAGEDTPGTANAATPAPATAAKPGAKKQRKRKITVEDVKERGALPDLFYSFPLAFKKQYRGKGHEASDLRRLLEMYRRWQQRFFPQHGFDEVLDSVAQLGRSHRTRVELHELRQGVLKELEAAAAAERGREAPDEPPGDWMGMGDRGGGTGSPQPGTPLPGVLPAASALAGSAAGGKARGGGFGNDDDGFDDDEELLAMQRDSAWEDQLAAAPDELLALDDDVVRPPRPGPAPAAAAAAPDPNPNSDPDAAPAPAGNAEDEDEAAQMAAFQAALDAMDDEEDAGTQQTAAALLSANRSPEGLVQAAAASADGEEGS